MGQHRQFFRKPYVVMGLGTIIFFLLFLGLRNRGSLEFLELAAYDGFIRMQPKLPTENRRITVVEITEKDIQAIGHWPLTDEALTRALTILLKGNPRAIGLDIFRDIPVPPGREALNDIFVRNSRIIGVMTVGENGVAPLAVIRNTDQAAFGDILVDPDGIVRRGLLFLNDGQNVYTSFGLRLATLYLEAEGIALQPDPQYPEYVRLKETTIAPLEENDGGYAKADARGYQFLLDFKDAGMPFRTYSFSSLMSGKIPPEAIADRIVLIGVNAQSVEDHFFTPLSKGHTDDLRVPGIVMHGYMISQLLRFGLDGDSPIKAPTEKQKIVWLLLWSIMGSVVGFYTRSAWRSLLLIAAGLLVLFWAAYFALVSHWWIPLAPPVLSFFMAAAGVTAYMTGLEKRERAMLMQIFSKHVSKEVAVMLWQQRDQFLENGRPRSRNMTVTVFFSDLKGFTTMSEKMPPRDLIDWLNTYMESMTDLIMAHGGIVDDYAGDGIKAYFGGPIPRQNEDEVGKDALNAVSCALAMEKKLGRLNALWREEGLPSIGIRIGIFTGPVVGGLIGSSQRLKYTTVGDTVNIAARLESYDKEVGKETLCRIIIGDSTLHYLDARYKTERLGEVSLKGKDEKITIHRVLGENLPGSLTGTKEVFHE
jgi:adenylate cyclase